MVTFPVGWLHTFKRLSGESDSASPCVWFNFFPPKPAGYNLSTYSLFHYLWIGPRADLSYNLCLMCIQHVVYIIAIYSMFIKCSSWNQILSQQFSCRCSCIQMTLSGEGTILPPNPPQGHMKPGTQRGADRGQFFSEGELLFPDGNASTILVFGSVIKD